MRLLFLGFGTVGQGLAELLLAKRDELKTRYGFDWKVTGIADTLKGNAYDPKGIDLAKALELAAGGESLAALERGVHVVTTNKGPLALHYRELAGLAARRKIEFLFEGTVMSGTPVLNLVRETLAGAEILEMQGILNGTTNYILTRMEEGLSYEAALTKAQELGYAEAVPDADVLGWDALAKVTILANVVFGAG